MGLFDAITDEVRQKFDLGDKAEGLLKILVLMISDREQGGFSGFMNSFNEAGLGDLASSWVNSGANMPLSYEQTESVFGEVTLKEMSDEVGIDYKTTTLATAALVSHVVDQLTPNGELPDDKDLAATLGGYVDKPEPIAAKTAAATPENSRTTGTGEESYESPNSLLKIILPLTIVALLILVTYMLCGPQAGSNVNSNSKKTTVSNSARPGNTR